MPEESEQRPTSLRLGYFQLGMGEPFGSGTLVEAKAEKTANIETEKTANIEAKA